MMMYHQEDYVCEQTAAAAYAVDPFMLQTQCTPLALDLTPLYMPDPTTAVGGATLDESALPYPPSFYSPVPSPVDDGFDFFASAYSPSLQDDLPTPPPALPAFHDFGCAPADSSLLMNPPYSPPPESPVESKCMASDMCCSSVELGMPALPAAAAAAGSSPTTTHMRHDDIRPFACPMCSRAFKRKHDLQRHVRVHTGAKPYACLCCRKAFARTDALKRHLRMEEACRTSPEIQAMKCAGKRRYRNL